MKISTAFFGHQEIDPESLITFPKGIPGLEGETSFKLFSEEGSPTVMWLQSVNDVDVVFSVASPATFNLGYELILSDEEVELIGLEAPEDVEVLVILHKNQERSEGDEEVTAASGNIHAHIKGPLLINTKSRLGMQKALAEVERYSVIREASNG